METKETKPAEKTVTGHTPTVHAEVTVDEKKKKRKYSKGTESAQQVGRGVNKAAAHMAEAVSKALDTYQERAKESSYKKKDGMLRDSVENLSKAAAKGMKRAADVPYDVVKSVSRGKAGKQLRNTAKMFAPPMFR